MTRYQLQVYKTVNPVQITRDIDTSSRLKYPADELFF